MYTFKDAVPFMALPPTEIVRDEMKARHLHRHNMARRLGSSVHTLTRWLKSNAPITEDVAARLERALGIPAGYWLRLQAQYETDAENIKTQRQ